MLCYNWSNSRIIMCYRPAPNNRTTIVHTYLMHVFSKSWIQTKSKSLPKKSKQNSNFFVNNNIKKLHQTLLNSTCTKEADQMVANAFKMYQNIQENKNHFVINTMLKVCFDSGYYSHVSSIWQDIELLHTTNHPDKQKILYYVLIQCVSKSNEIDITQCIQILKHIKECEYKLKLTAPFMNQLLLKSITDLNSLKYILNVDNLLLTHTYTIKHSTASKHGLL
eukprot:938617_1